MNCDRLSHPAIVAVCALALGAGTLSAQSLDTTISVRSGTRLSVSNIAGSITVRAGGRQRIRVQAQFDRARVQIDESPGQLSVRTLSRRGDAEVEYMFTVPAGTALDLNAVSSDVDVGGVCGAANVNSVSGSVALVCAAGDVTVQSVSGDVTVSDVRGPLDAGSVSGEVTVRGARGDVNAHTVSGEIMMAEIDGTDVSAETVSGEIFFSGRIADDGRYRFEAHSGDVTVRVAGNLNATIAVSTFSGDFESDFPIVLNPGRRPSREWEFTQGSGSARLRLRSFSGTIYLRRGAGGAAPRREER